MPETELKLRILDSICHYSDGFISEYFVPHLFQFILQEPDYLVKMLRLEDTCLRRRLRYGVRSIRNRPLFVYGAYSSHPYTLDMFDAYLDSIAASLASIKDRNMIREFRREAEDIFSQ